jgi:hypothetical protein
MLGNTQLVGHLVNDEIVLDTRRELKARIPFAPTLETTAAAR